MCVLEADIQVADPGPDIAWSPEVHAALQESLLGWIHEPGLWRSLADSQVPMTFVAAGADIRPSWPLAQLGELVPGGRFETIPDVPHDFWHTHPELWGEVVTAACRRHEIGPLHSL